MPGIRSSVGRSGRNTRRDTEIVQTLLNNHLTSIGRKHPLAEDGRAGDKTINAIVRFQQRVVGTHQPDGRVDPNGRTIRALNEEPITLVELPQDGTDYYSYAPSREQFGTSDTIGSMTQVARRVLEEIGVEIGIGDISLDGGGRMPGHRSHRFGLDVDIRPLRADGRRLPVTIDNLQAYSRRRTRALVRLLRAQPKIELILFNDDQIAGVKFFRGHRNHLHVRFLP